MDSSEGVGVGGGGGGTAKRGMAASASSKTDIVSLCGKVCTSVYSRSTAPACARLTAMTSIDRSIINIDRLSCCPPPSPTTPGDAFTTPLLIEGRGVEIGREGVGRSVVVFKYLVVITC